MNKKGNTDGIVDHLKITYKVIKQSYLCRLITKFLSVVCSIILVILLVVGSLMFFYNSKAKSYEKNGMEYTVPFGLYTIISGSMEPNVEVYDVVIAADYDVSKIKVGDIITFVSNWEINYGKTVTHRVVAISKSETGEYQLTTKGDNNNMKDGGIVTQQNLVGKVVGRLPQLGRLQVFLATKMGWFMVVFIPALAIIIFDMIKVFKLYVLKEQIDKVKTPKEAAKEKKKQELEKAEKSLNNDKEKIVTKKDRLEIKKPVSIPQSKTILDDQNIDTVELPKIGLNGKITEKIGDVKKIDNSTELKNDQKESIELPKIDNSLPLLKNSADDSQAHQELQRTQLKRRN